MQVKGALMNRKIEFFFDPMCPWAYICSRWIKEVQKEIPLDVRWRFLSLSYLNKDNELDARHKEMHRTGARLLRMASYIENSLGQGALDQWYTLVAKEIHVNSNISKIEELLPQILKKMGVDDPQDYMASLADETIDSRLIKDTEDALERAGKDLGTPIITFEPPSGYSFFGPVLSKIPRGREAVQLFEHVYAIGTFEGFNELKRSARLERSFD
jgi:2-hydroxychromene-2-carboxylate isomerase